MSDNSGNRTQDLRERLQSARQVLAGDAVRPSPDPWVVNNPSMPFTALQRNYLILLVALVLVSLLLVWLTGLGIASIVLAILGVLLIAGWLIF
ncbi:MAG: hypothetical protein ACTHMX_06975 [Thermomicrobiales bacterium]|jgi:hypothetical protein